jgi:hypothetical protein
VGCVGLFGVPGAAVNFLVSRKLWGGMAGQDVVASTQTVQTAKASLQAKPRSYRGLLSNRKLDMGMGRLIVNVDSVVITSIVC